LCQSTCSLACVLASVLACGMQLVSTIELLTAYWVCGVVCVSWSSVVPSREQAGAALANACANCMENQIAARHCGAVSVLVEQMVHEQSLDLTECCVCAIRNLCINSLEHQEELMRCNGMVPLLQMLQHDTRPQLLEYVASALAKVSFPHTHPPTHLHHCMPLHDCGVKKVQDEGRCRRCAGPLTYGVCVHGVCVHGVCVQACSMCQANLNVLRTQYGVGSLKWLMADANVTDDVKRHIQVLLDYLAAVPYYEL